MSKHIKITTIAAHHSGNISTTIIEDTMKVLPEHRKIVNVFYTDGLSLHLHKGFYIYMPGIRKLSIFISVPEQTISRIQK